jgi:hypothetical protein
MVFAVACVAVSACSSGSRREAQAVAQAVERFRRADNAQKPAMADALRATPCTEADVCRARDACLASAEATAKAMRLKNEIELGIAALERDAMARDSDEALGLPQKLDEAEALLKEGFDRLPLCDDAIVGLKRQYRF